MGNDINVGSYDSLREGANTIRRASGELKQELQNGDGYIRNIQRERVFEGPIAEHVSGVWNVINNITINNINNFENSAKTLDTINDNYQQRDTKSSNDVGGII